MKKIEEKKKNNELAIATVKQTLTLITSGFGFVAALAWNNLIEDVINSYIKKWLPKGSGAISLLVYALIVTMLAVLITLQLSKILARLESEVNS